MGQLFAGFLLIYMIVAMAFLPLVSVDTYLGARDCKTKYQVSECERVFLPKGPPHD